MSWFNKKRTLVASMTRLCIKCGAVYIKNIVNFSCKEEVFKTFHNKKCQCGGKIIAAEDMGKNFYG